MANFSYNNLNVNINDENDAKLSVFGKAVLKDRYLLPNESIQQLFARVSCSFADDNNHAQRLYDYISNLWFMPATPILSNGGTERGLPISCFLNECSDSLQGIVDLFNENVWLASRGGGIGSYWGNLRSIGEKVRGNGKTSGIIPFIKVMDSQTLAISQGCYDDETEVLTEKGFIKFADLEKYKKTLKIAQVNQDGSSFNFVNYNNYIKYNVSEELYHFKNPEKHIDLLVTANHRMATQHVSKIKINNVTKKQWKNDFKITEADQLSCNRDVRFVNSAPKIKGNKQFLTTLERFFIAYQADGSTNPTGLSNGRLSGTIIYTFHFKKERKIKRLESIINELGFYYTKKPGKNNDFNILVRVPNNISLKKDFNEWIDLKSINQEWAVSFIDELRHWDGSFKNDNSVRYSTTNKNNADITQIIGIIAGYKTKLRKITRDISRKDLFDVSFVKNSRYTSAENIKPQKQYYNGFVYCLSVPTGLLIVRRAGSVAVCGNSLRRGSAAVYLPINHPEIEEFIDIRRPHGGDTNRRSLNLHHGVVVDDEFMKAVEKNLDFDLKSPYSGKTIEKINARDLWIKLLTARIETGEPYILYIDNVNKSIPNHHKKLNLNVKTSNLCAEITLPTGIDHHNQQRTAVCCLSSLNLEFYDQWKDNQLIIEDIMRFLDNVLQDFINKAPDSMKNAKYSASRERSVGLGVMGFHSFLQNKNVPIESAMSKVWNKKIFQNIKQQADKISEKLAIEKGACPDAVECNIMERFSNKLAIAPTASISIIANNSSPGIEPFAANSFTQKTLTGSFNVRNKNLEKLLESKQKNTEDIWSSITINEGSVQHLDFLDEHEKLVFKTAQEIDQRWIIDLASDRQEYICQSQSLNIFLPGNVSKKTLHEIHFRAWQKKVKSLYYCRSTSLQRAAKVSNKSEVNEIKIDNNQEECLACQ